MSREAASAPHPGGFSRPPAAGTWSLAAVKAGVGHQSPSKACFRGGLRVPLKVSRNGLVMPGLGSMG